MKKTILRTLTIALFTLCFVTAVKAQLPANNIETLLIDLWPDYDEPSVLVLLTGTLPLDTPLPASVTIPLPAEADVNAVARITSDNQMVDDLEYTTGNNTLTFTTPDPHFRIEYYAPYERIGSTHSFSFDWLADISVGDVLAAVQQPSSAVDMNVTPDNANVVTDTTDGFTYHTFPPQPIPAGEIFKITFDYEMANPQLSIEDLSETSSGSAINSGSSSASNPSPDAFNLDNVNWLMVGGIMAVILTAVLITWLVATRQTQPTRSNRKPRPKRANSSPKQSGKARFCHQCGNGLNPQDKFCRNCGTAVKGS